MDLTYQTTQDGNGSWAVMDDYRIVIKQSKKKNEHNASWWYGIYHLNGGRGKTAIEGMAHSEEEAKEWAEMSVQQQGDPL